MGRVVTFHFGLRVLKSSAVNSPHFTSRLDCEMSGNICKTEINIYVKCVQRNQYPWGLNLHFCLSPEEACFHLSSWTGVSHGRHLQLKADMNDWAREALMKSWPVYDILVQQFCIYWRGKQKLRASDFVRKEKKYTRLEQGPGNGWAHLALKFNLLAEVD